MKKILVIIMGLLLIASCGKKEEDVAIEEGAEKITNILEQETSETANEEVIDDKKTVTTKFTDDTGTGTTVEVSVGSGELDSKTEEQIVKEFEAEIDSLFNLIDEDGKK